MCKRAIKNTRCQTRRSRKTQHDGKSQMPGLERAGFFRFFRFFHVQHTLFMNNSLEFMEAGRIVP